MQTHSRRSFLKAGAAAGGALLVPASILGARPAAAAGTRHTVIGCAVTPSGSGEASYADFHAFETECGQHVDAVLYLNAFPSEPLLYSQAVSDCAKGGWIPNVAWDPTVPLTDITNGTYDQQLIDAAQTARSSGLNEIELRWCHEFNLPGQNWPAGDFVPCWQHVHSIFVDQGASNVHMMWCPNYWTSSSSAKDPAPWWPGASTVNVIGIDGYSYTNDGFPSLEEIFLSPVNELTQYGLPVKIAETGVSADNPNKGTWYDNCWTYLQPGGSLNAVTGFYYWDRVASEGDYRIDQPSSALPHFQQLAADFAAYTS